MDIQIEAPQHEHQKQLISFYKEKLNKKYAVYDFIKMIEVKVRLEKDAHTTVSLQCKPEKGKMLYASHTHGNENKALMETIRKLNIQIEKYKQVHYHSH